MAKTTQQNVETLQRSVLQWYHQYARPLPWRESRDPYRVWISEVMLQQTQVSTVEAYFRRFVERLPTVAHLAEATETEVLRLWEGLGYYRRARQMHHAARRIVRHHAGQFPDNLKDVLDLPGIGRYTAGAILSIAFGQPQPVLEANTIRLYCRLLNFDGNPHSSAGQRRLWQFAERVVPRSQPGLFNQGLMELGSMLCRPARPSCSQCPITDHCAAYQAGRQAEIPQRKPKTVYSDRTELAVVVRKKGHVLLRQCGPGERWEGLWDVPRFTPSNGQRPAPGPKSANANADAGRAAACAVSDHLRQEYALQVDCPEPLTTIRHAVTRFRITLHCFHTEWQAGRLPRRANGAAPRRWVRVDSLEQFPLSTTGRKIAKLLRATRR